MVINEKRIGCTYDFTCVMESYVVFKNYEIKHVAGHYIGIAHQK